MLLDQVRRKSNPKSLQREMTLRRSKNSGFGPKRWMSTSVEAADGAAVTVTSKDKAKEPTFYQRCKWIVFGRPKPEIEGKEKTSEIPTLEEFFAKHPKDSTEILSNSGRRQTSPPEPFVAWVQDVGSSATFAQSHGDEDHSHETVVIAVSTSNVHVETWELQDVEDAHIDIFSNIPGSIYGSDDSNRSSGGPPSVGSSRSSSSGCPSIPDSDSSALSDSIFQV